MPIAQKQLIHASQIAAHKTLSAPESPLSLCYVTDRKRRGEWNCVCAQNCCFVPCGKLTNACAFKAVMADWNRSSHFDTPCIYSLRIGPFKGRVLVDRDIPHAFWPTLGPTQLPVQWRSGLLRPKCDVDHLPLSRTEIKERLELYFYFSSGLSCSVVGSPWPLLSPLLHCKNLCPII